ncbi:MAG: hypothetical protein OSA97_08170 [Nevskia sp.]|nr:hypothetical protein [Nevskia sp.]
MNLLLWCLIAANVTALAWLIRRQRLLRHELAAAQRQLEQWGAAGLGALAPNVFAALGRPSLISVEILNPMELAMRESPLAKAFGSLTPELVRREVYKEIYQRLCTQLQEQGVVAEVRLHDGAR